MNYFYSNRVDIDDELLSSEPSYSLYTVYEDAWEAMKSIRNPLDSLTNCVLFTRMV